ncbi:unnamed protein product [Phaeothamnion confervicola]
MPFVDKKKLIDALDEQDPGKLYFIDRQTAVITMLTLEDKAGFERMKKMLAVDAKRFSQVPKSDASQNLAELEKFIAMVHDPRLKETLTRCLSAHRPFREFRDVLATKVKEKREWDVFHRKNLEDKAVRFLKSAGLQ